MDVIEQNSVLRFYPLTFVTEASGVTIGRLDIDTYADFPPDGAALLKQLQAGLAPQEAAAWYQQRYGESVDMQDFLSILHDLQFIQESDGSQGTMAEVVAGRVRWQWLGQALFSPLAWIVYALMFIVVGYDMVRFPQLIPSTQNLIFTQYATLNTLVLFLGQFPGLLFHESFHALAGRRLGLPSRLGIGRRLIFVVFETSLSGLWSVSRRARYLPFLAGMLADSLLFAGLTLFAGATLLPNGALSPLGAVSLALAFTTLLRLQWQFYFYLRTDIYYIFTHATGCVNLQDTTQRYLRNILFRLLGRRDKMEDPEVWHPRDRQIARWYAPLYLLGCLFTIGATVLVVIPVTLHFLFISATHIMTGVGTDASQFWDGLTFLLLTAAQFLVVGFLYRRERKYKEAGS